MLLLQFVQQARRGFLPLGRPGQHAVEDFPHLLLSHDVKIALYPPAFKPGG